MKLENQVVSLNLAKRLKGIGVKQCSHFFWEEPNREWGHIEWCVTHELNDDLKHFSAFTVAELGELLIGDRDFFSGRNWNDAVFGCNAYRGRDYVHRVEADTEADARAKMLIYLIENGHIESPVR